MTSCETLVEEVIEAQKRFFGAIEQAAVPMWLQLNVSMAQLKALVSLAHINPMTVTELASTLGVGKPAASILVDRLVEHGLVEREEDPDDRRRTLLRLSESGDEMIIDLQRGGQQRMREWLCRLDEEDLMALAQGLRALTQSAIADEAVPSVN